MNENLKPIEKTFSHVVTLDNRKKMMLTGIIEVISATEKSIIARTEQKTINIVGSNLRVGKLNLEEGLLIIEGEIDSFKYVENSGSKSFFKKVFK